MGVLSHKHHLSRSLCRSEQHFTSLGHDRGFHGHFLSADLEEMRKLGQTLRERENYRCLRCEQSGA